MASRRILIIKLGALGDVVLATGFIDAICRSHPGSECLLLTRPRYAELLSQGRDVRVLTLSHSGIRAFTNTVRELRQMRISAIYDLQCSDRTRLLCLLSGVPFRVGLGPAWVYRTYLPNDDSSRHPWERLAALLARAGVAGAWNAEPRLCPSAQAVAAAERWLIKRGLRARSYALLQPGSSPRWISKRWGMTRFVALAKGLIANGVIPVWIGSREERALLTKSPPGVDAIGELSLPELVAVARGARFAITGDSGPMHLVAAVGTPVYAVFGPTDPARHWARGQAHRVLKGEAPCAPCYLPVCPPGHGHRCMASLAPERVVARLRADGMLGTAGADDG